MGIAMKNSMEEILNRYYENNAKKLHTMVDNVLFKLKLNVDKEDFYSLANEIFVDVMNRYDDNRDFDCFLYSCLLNKFKTEMTRRNRQKRQADREALSLNMQIGTNDESITLEDTVAHKDTVESTYFNEEDYSNKMMKYLNRLSYIQREVLRLISIGYSSNEIEKELNISNKECKNCIMAIRSFRNTSVLM
jgi:DNA-directed RNA polymerase specialized sigma24 family protein